MKDMVRRPTRGRLKGDLFFVRLRHSDIDPNGIGQMSDVLQAPSIEGF